MQSKPPNSNVYQHLTRDFDSTTIATVELMSQVMCMQTAASPPTTEGPAVNQFKKQLVENKIIKKSLAGFWPDELTDASHHSAGATPVFGRKEGKRAQKRGKAKVRVAQRSRETSPALPAFASDEYSYLELFKISGFLRWDVWEDITVE